MMPILAGGNLVTAEEGETGLLDITCAHLSFRRSGLYQKQSRWLHARAGVFKSMDTLLAIAVRLSGLF